MSEQAPHIPSEQVLDTAMRHLPTEMSPVELGAQGLQREIMVKDEPTNTVEQTVEVKWDSEGSTVDGERGLAVRDTRTVDQDGVAKSQVEYTDVSRYGKQLTGKLGERLDTTPDQVLVDRRVVTGDGQIEQGAVSKLTGERAQKAREILQRGAAKLLLKEMNGPQEPENGPAQSNEQKAA